MAGVSGRTVKLLERIAKARTPFRGGRAGQDEVSPGLGRLGKEALQREPRSVLGGGTQDAT